MVATWQIRLYDCSRRRCTLSLTLATCFFSLVTTVRSESVNVSESVPDRETLLQQTTNRKLYGLPTGVACQGGLESEPPSHERSDLRDFHKCDKKVLKFASLQNKWRSLRHKSSSKLRQSPNKISRKITALLKADGQVCHLFCSLLRHKFLAMPLG